MSTRWRRSACLLALVGAATVACGDPAPFPPEHWLARLNNEDQAKRQEAIDALGRLGREDPEKVGALLVGLLERAGEQTILVVRVEPDFAGMGPEERERLMPRLDVGVRGRLGLAGGTVALTMIEPDAIHAYVVRPAAKDLATAQALVVAEAARPGTIDLRVELPAPFTPDAERPVSPFAGDGSAYEAWLAAEQASLAGSGAQGYRPAAAGRRLLPRAAAGPAEGSGPVPALDPQGPPQTFTEADLEFLPQDDLGVPALAVAPVPSRAADFRAFLKAHAGLPLWLVVDGEATLVARIPVQAAERIVFRVRAATLAEGRTRAAMVAALAALGRFPVPMKASTKPRAPLIAGDNPLATAIVAMGPAVEPRLDALAQKDPSWIPLVDSLKEAILKGRAQR